MNNWKNIHPEFTDELQKEWEEKGFNYQECKEWITIGLNVNDASFVFWLRNQSLTPEKCLNKGNITELKETYKQRKGKEKAIEKVSYSFEDWWEKGFTNQEIQEWINLGLGLNEVIFVTYLKSKGYNYAWTLPGDILPHLRKEYQEKIIQEVGILLEKFKEELQAVQIEQRNNLPSFPDK